MSTYVATQSTITVTGEVVEAMHKRDVSVEDLAALTGLGVITLRNRIALRAPWDVEQVYRVADALDVELATLLGCSGRAA